MWRRRVSLIWLLGLGCSGPTCSGPPVFETIELALPPATNAALQPVRDFALYAAPAGASEDEHLEKVCARQDRARFVRPMTIEVSLDRVAVMGRTIDTLDTDRLAASESFLVEPLLDELQRRIEFDRKVEGLCPVAVRRGASPARHDRVLLAIDPRLPAEIMYRVVYTAGQAGLRKFAFLVAEPDPASRRRRRAGSGAKPGHLDHVEGPGSVLSALASSDREVRLRLLGDRVRLTGDEVDVTVPGSNWRLLTWSLARLPEDLQPTISVAPDVSMGDLVRAIDLLDPWFSQRPIIGVDEGAGEAPPFEGPVQVRAHALSIDGAVPTLMLRAPSVGSGPEAGDDEVERYPVMAGPDRVEVGQTFSLIVQLAEKARQAVVRGEAAEVAAEMAAGAVAVHEGDATGSGALKLDMGGAQTLKVDVVLNAPGFDAPSFEKTIRVPRRGNSTPARFSLTLREAPEEGPAFVQAWLFFGEGGYARIGRAFQIEGAPPSFTGSRSSSRVPSAEDRSDASADVMVVLLTDKRFGADVAQVIVKVKGRPEVSMAFVDLPPGRRAWLAERALGAGLVRGLRRSKNKATQAATLAGLGDEIWSRLIPAPVRRALCTAKDQLGDAFTSIQIYTNDPSIPWELARMTCDGQRGDFLAVAYRLARWHVVNGFDPTLPDPPAELTVSELVAIAPNYEADKALPGQAVELAALRAWPSFERVGGALDDVANVVRRAPQGIVHFSGHGVVTAGEVPEYALELEDGRLPVQAWRGLSAGLHRHPLVFFNACDVGRSDAVAGFVDGWAPAVLETGASGYIGGLWPLEDEGAAAFAERFYGELDAGLRQTGSVALADVLRRVRAEYHARGDPTFLAYAYYGDANLRLTRR